MIVTCERACIYVYAWAVSYTHLDVYKRQVCVCARVFIPVWFTIITPEFFLQLDIFVTIINKIFCKILYAYIYTILSYVRSQDNSASSETKKCINVNRFYPDWNISIVLIFVNEVSFYQLYSEFSCCHYF